MESFGKAEELKQIGEGQHVGTITSITRRDTEKWGAYVDFTVKTESGETAKFSLPLPEQLHEKTQLGQLIRNVTGSFEVDREYTPSDLEGSKISFQTTENENGYIEVVKQINKKFAIQGAK